MVINNKHHKSCVVNVDIRAFVTAHNGDVLSGQVIDVEQALYYDAVFVAQLDNVNANVDRSDLTFH